MALTGKEKQAAFRARRKAAVAEVVTLRAENASLRNELATLRQENARLARATASAKVTASISTNRPASTPVRVRLPAAPVEARPARSLTSIRVRI